MPELPEVETTVRDLKRKVLERTIFDVWTDFEKMIKKPSFEQFKKEIKGKKIERVWRRGKNILFDLSGEKTLLIHQKLSGHLLYGKWQMVNGKWKPEKKGPLEEKINSYIHLMFTFDDGQMLALSDLRKFAKVELLNKEELKKEISILGAEPLEKSFTLKKFKEVLGKRKGKIKQVLMDQSVIAGIGNIYSSEILWEAKVNPFKEVEKLTNKELERIYEAMKKVLKRAIELKGESISDFRRISGEKGFFDRERKVYRREGKKCPRCGSKILKKEIGGRSAYFCSNCQK